VGVGFRLPDAAKSWAPTRLAELYQLLVHRRLPILTEPYESLAERSRVVPSCSAVSYGEWTSSSTQNRGNPPSRQQTRIALGPAATATSPLTSARLRSAATCGGRPIARNPISVRALNKASRASAIAFLGMLAA
jgi:hypothetical protein